MCHFLILLVIFLVLLLGCTEGNVRLVDYDTQSYGGLQGLVEVCRNDTWGYVCGINWDVQDLMVVCRELGQPIIGNCLCVIKLNQKPLFGRYMSNL